MPRRWKAIRLPTSCLRGRAGADALQEDTESSRTFVTVFSDARWLLRAEAAHVQDQDRILQIQLRSSVQDAALRPTLSELGTCMTWGVCMDVHAVFEHGTVSHSLGKERIG
jgi:hypothetical protein